jgi:hypothetical protein
MIRNPLSRIKSTLFNNQQGGRVKSQARTAAAYFTIPLHNIQGDAFLFRIRLQQNNSVKQSVCFMTRGRDTRFADPVIVSMAHCGNPDVDI